MDTQTLLWLVLAVTIGTVLVIDLVVVDRRAHAPTFREAAVASAIYVGLGLLFGVLVAVTRGPADGSAYLAGYLLELSLSVDNVFVFAMIFAAFAVPLPFQHRVLFYGILGAIVFRALFIGLGAAIIERFHWAIYGFGILLLVTGWRMWTHRHEEVLDPGRNPVLRLFRRFVPMTDGYREQRFVVLESGRRLATPLLAVLVTIETSDILFAIDSVPAIFSVTTDAFLVFSSNAFAILGLRSLYFLLAGAVDRFRYLKPGLAALLIFAGAKILVADVIEIPIALSLGIIVAILAVSIGASIVADRRGHRQDAAAPASGTTGSAGGTAAGGPPSGTR
jgi:tellurite resistance protein TerC